MIAFAKFRMFVFRTSVDSASPFGQSLFSVLKKHAPLRVFSELA